MPSSKAFLKQLTGGDGIPAEAERVARGDKGCLPTRVGLQGGAVGRKGRFNVVGPQSFPSDEEVREVDKISLLGVLRDPLKPCEALLRTAQKQLDAPEPQLRFGTTGVEGEGLLVQILGLQQQATPLALH